jgi:hypothetical protein
MFLDVCCNRFYRDVAYVFKHMLQQYVPNVLVVSVLCYSKCFFMLQLFYLDVAYVSHMLQTYVPNVSSVSNVCCIQVFSCCKCRPPASVSMRQTGPIHDHRRVEEVAWAAHKSERMGRSSHGRPDGRRRPDVWALVLSFP